MPIEVTLPATQENIVKKWHDGKTTYASTAATFVVAIGSLLGYSLNDTLPLEIARFGDTIEFALIAVFAAIAFYGRAKAITAGFIGKKRVNP
jgi:hypothetical protein